MSYAEQRRRQSRETEKRLMQTAWELMSEQSFDAVSVRDICRKAGVTTGAFYHHFPTKEALLDRGYERMDDFIRARVEKSPAENKAQVAENQRQPKTAAQPPREKKNKNK